VFSCNMVQYIYWDEVTDTLFLKYYLHVFIKQQRFINIHFCYCIKFSMCYRGKEQCHCFLSNMFLKCFCILSTSVCQWSATVFESFHGAALICITTLGIFPNTVLAPPVHLLPYFWKSV
jgi:hypothetical protein